MRKAHYFARCARWKRRETQRASTHLKGTAPFLTTSPLPGAPCPQHPKLAQGASSANPRGRNLRAALRRAGACSLAREA